MRRAPESKHFFWPNEIESEIEVAIETEFKIEITIETTNAMSYPPFRLGRGQKKDQKPIRRKRLMPDE